MTDYHHSINRLAHGLFYGGTEYVISGHLHIFAFEALNNAF